MIGPSSRVLRSLVVVLAAAGVSACAMPSSDILKPEFWAGSPLKDNDEAELGLAELAKGNYVTAEAHFLKALEANPQDVHALLGSGILYQNTGQQTKARSMYEAVLAIRPPQTEQFVVWNNIATRPVAEIASVNVALMNSGTVVEGMQRGAAGGQLGPDGRPLGNGAQAQVPLANAEARAPAPMPMASASPMAPTGTGQGIVAGPMIARFADGDANIVSRFETLKTLRDQEMITPEEYAARRQANVGALLPLTAPPPAAGLDRPVPSTEQIVGRLRAIGRAREVRAITVGQHASERSMILDALLPAAPVAVANPAPPPEGLMEAADAVRRLEILRDTGYITSDEYTRERAEVERALQPGPAMRSSAAPSPQAEPMAATPMAARGPAPAVHLASYRSRKQAERGWSELRQTHPELLRGLEAAVTEVNLGPGKGLYYRLKAGPVETKDAADALCRALKRRRQYCEPTIMERG